MPCLIINLLLFICVLCYYIYFVIIIMGKEKSQINLQYDRQLQNNEAQNRWQSSENDRDFLRQQEAWMQQFVAQANEWTRQFNLQNEYNSPSAQVSRLLAAGINPAAGGVSGVDSGSASGSPSMPSPSGIGSHGVSPLSLNNPSVSTSSDAAMFSSIAQLNDSIAKMVKSGSDISVDQRKIGAVVDNLISDTENKREGTILTRIEAGLRSAFGDKELRVRINKMVAESYAAYCGGDLAKANELLSSAQERLTSVEADIKAGASADILQGFKELNKLYKAQQLSQQASAAASRSQVGLNRAQGAYLVALTATADDLRKGQLDAQKFENAMLEASAEIRKRENVRDLTTNAEQIHIIFEQAENAGLVNEQVRQAISKAIQENDWYAVSQATEVLGKFVGARANLLNARSNSFNAFTNSVSADSRARLNDAMADALRIRYGY